MIYFLKKVAISRKNRDFKLFQPNIDTFAPPQAPPRANAAVLSGRGPCSTYNLKPRNTSLASDKKQLANNPFSAKNRDFGPYFDLSKLALGRFFCTLLPTCRGAADTTLTPNSETPISSTTWACTDLKTLKTPEAAYTHPSPRHAPAAIIYSFHSTPHH